MWESGGGSLEEEAGRGVHGMGQRAHKLPRCWGRERKGNGRGRRVAPNEKLHCDVDRMLLLNKAFVLSEGVNLCSEIVS